MASSTSSRATEPAATTERAASSPNPPAKVASRRKTARSGASSIAWLHSIEAASVCWRGTAPRGPLTSSANRSSRPASICWGVSVPSQAAASSSASGMPSRREHIVRTAASPGPSRVSQGRTAPARSTNRASASSSASGGTRQTASPGTASGSRLVVSTVTSGQARSTAVGHLGGALQHVLAVVQAQEHATVPQLHRHRPERAADGLHQHPGRRGDDLGDVGGVGHRAELDPPDTVRPPLDQVGGDLAGQAGLARAADAGQGHHPCRPAAGRGRHRARPAVRRTR